LKKRIADLEAENARLRAPVSDKEKRRFGYPLLGTGVIDSDSYRFSVGDIDRLTASRIAARTAPKEKP